MWKNSFHLGSARRPLPGVLSTHRGPVPDRTQCPWIWTNPEVYLPHPGERLHDYLRAFYHIFMGEPTLYIIDDCSPSMALTKKKTCCHCLLSRAAMQSSLSVSSLKIQLCPEGLPRADALGLFISLQRPRFLR